MVGRNVDRIDGRDLYSAAKLSRRNCLITIVTPAVYPHFLEFLRVDIQNTGHTLSRLWSRQPNDVMSEIECAQLHSELFRRRHSTRQSHGLFALAKPLFRFLSKSQRLIVSGAVNLVRRRTRLSAHLMVGGNVDRIHGRDLYSAAKPRRRNCLITIVTPAVYPRFFEFLHVDIQSTGRTLPRPWSRQLNDVMSEIECAQLHSELFRRRHSTRQSHGLFALAKHWF